jgi:hypothetical protein
MEIEQAARRAAAWYQALAEQTSLVCAAKTVEELIAAS